MNIIARDNQIIRQMQKIIESELADQKRLAGKRDTIGVTYTAGRISAFNKAIQLLEEARK